MGNPSAVEKEELRLYCVKCMATKEIIACFSSKRQAKTARNQAIADTGEQHVVSLGPDHHRYEEKQ